MEYVPTVSGIGERISRDFVKIVWNGGPALWVIMNSLATLTMFTFPLGLGGRGGIRKRDSFFLAVEKGTRTKGNVSTKGRRNKRCILPCFVSSSMNFGGLYLVGNPRSTATHKIEMQLFTAILFVEDSISSSDGTPLGFEVCVAADLNAPNTGQDLTAGLSITNR